MQQPYMDRIREIAGNGALMPRFNDGMANMTELIRVMTESLVVFDSLLIAQKSRAAFHS